MFHLHFKAIIIIFSLLFLLLSACSKGEKNFRRNEEALADTLIRDGAGREINIPRNPKRIVSLAPSSTEILYFIADTACIVGRSHACDYPPEVKNKPVVNTYLLDLEQLISLKPDLVITVDGMLPPGDIDRIEKEGVPVYAQHFKKVSDIIDDMRVLAVLTNREKQAESLIDSLGRGVKILEEEVKLHSTQPKILALISADPIYVFGKNSFFTDVIRLSGGKNAINEVFGSAYPAVSVEYLLKINPDIIIGYNFQQADSSFFKLYPTLKRINAYQNKNIFDFNDDLMTRPGPRFLQAIHELKEIIQKSSIHPK